VTGLFKYAKKGLTEQKIPERKEVKAMLDCCGNPTKDTVVRFILKTTGKPWETTYVDLISPKINPISTKNFSHSSLPKGMVDFPKSFDYRDLVKEDKFLNPLGKPTKDQVADFMAEETGCSYESAITKLSVPKSSGGVKVIGGVRLYPASIIRVG
jgi:hypothetical protein